MRSVVATIVSLGLLALGAGLIAQSGNDLLQQALVKERTAGDLNAAIALYQTIVQKHGSDRALVAKALVQMGGCYEKLGSGEAIKTYQHVVRDFGDQKESVASARARLAALQASAASQAGPITRRIWDNADQQSYSLRAPSADGRYVSFSGEWDDLYVRDLREGTSHRLTTLSERTDTKESVAESLVSPDGLHVAYGWDSGPTFDLRILPLSGLNVEPRILHASDETEYMVPVGWTPDAKSLLVLRTLQDRTGQIAFLSIPDGSLRVLKSPKGWDQLGQVSLSPDGRFVAYSGPAGPGRPAHDIFVLASDGSRETVVAQSPAADVEPVWSPDGSQILFRSNRTGDISLWTVRIDAGRPTGLPELVRTDIGRLLGMTRSGALYYVTGGPTTNIYTVDVDANTKVTGAPVQATDRFVNGNTEPKWSRNGQTLAYRRGSSIVIRSIKTGDERVVLTDLRVAQLTGWFPDGRSLLVLSRDAEQNRTRFHRLDTTNGNAELLLSVKSDPLGIGFRSRPDLSSDGRSVFYIEGPREPGQSILMRFDIESRRSVELMRAVDAVAVSPDGAQLAFFGLEGLRVMPVGGGEPRQVSSGPGGGSQELTWTPDQRYLLFVAENSGRNVLWRIPVGGGERENTGLSGSVRFLTLHPGGHRITYQLREGRPYELWALESFLAKPRGSK